MTESETIECTRSELSIMPTFMANDGVDLHYQTHGSKENKPLILVNDPPLINPIQYDHLILPNSFTASLDPAKSSNAT